MSPAPLPTVVGHEFSGEVVELGEDVTSVAVGDLVAIEPLWPCGACAPCADGDPNLCWEVLCHGLGGPGGGLSEFTVVREHMAHKLPEGLGPVHGALVEPMSVAYRGGAAQPSRTPATPAVVFGGGPIGIGAYLALRRARRRRRDRGGAGGRTAAPRCGRSAPSACSTRLPPTSSRTCASTPAVPAPAS